MQKKLIRDNSESMKFKKNLNNAYHHYSLIKGTRISHSTRYNILSRKSNLSKSDKADEMNGKKMNIKVDIGKEKNRRGTNHQN